MVCPRVGALVVATVLLLGAVAALDARDALKLARLHRMSHHGHHGHRSHQEHHKHHRQHEQKEHHHSARFRSERGPVANLVNPAVNLITPLYDTDCGKPNSCPPVTTVRNIITDNDNYLLRLTASLKADSTDSCCESPCSARASTCVCAQACPTTQVTQDCCTLHKCALKPQGACPCEEACTKYEPELRDEGMLNTDGCCADPCGSRNKTCSGCVDKCEKEEADAAIEDPCCDKPCGVRSLTCKCRKNCKKLNEPECCELPC